MEFSISQSCQTAPNSEVSRKSQSNKTTQTDAEPFDAVLQKEEKKNSAEAETLMLATMQKPVAMQVADPGKGQQPESPVSVDPVLTENGLVADQVSNLPAGSTSQTADEGQSGLVGSSADVVDLPEGVEQKSGAEQNVNFSDLVEVTKEADQPAEEAPIQSTPTNIRVEGQVSDQSGNEKIQAAQKGENLSETQNSGEEIQVEKDETDPLQAFSKQENNEGVKFQVDQSVNKVSNQSEPARTAEAHQTPVVGQVSDHIETLLNQGRSSMRLQLSPHDLGKIDIRMVNGQNGLTVSVMTEQAKTGQLLEAQLDQLCQTLQDAGIQLANLQIGHQSAQHQQRQTWQMQSKNRRYFQTSEETATLEEKSRVVHSLQAVDYRV